MKHNKIQISLFTLAVFLLTGSLSSKAQEFNPVLTAVPSLQIAPDARAGGMGDIGAATMPDVYSQYWNPAKYPFASSNGGFAISYTPWLSKLVDDVHSLYAGGYWKFGNDDLNALSASIRYFSIGEFSISDADGSFLTNVSPYEMAFDMAYSRKLTETFSGAVTLRYIRSDFSSNLDEELSPGNAFAADISGYNESYVLLGQAEALWGLGFNISNIGTKISVDNGDTRMFLPTNLRLGTSLAYPIDNKNVIAISADINKLLVPTPKLPAENETTEQEQKRVEDYYNISPISGIFKSFGDAPGGFKEELQEVMWAIGAEYTYNKQFSLRTGYSHESEYKGNRRYFTLGAGFRTSAFQIDASYLISSAQTNPMDQTLRLSLAFDVEGVKNLFK